MSGLLIGAELAAARPYWLGQRVLVLGSEGLIGVYRAALDQLGAMAEVADGEALTLAGLIRARKLG